MGAPVGPAGVNNPNPGANPADDATASADDATTSTDDPGANPADDATTSTDEETAADDETNTAENVTSDETINDTGHPHPTPPLAIPDIALSGPTDPPEPATLTGVAQPAHVPEQTGATDEADRGELTGVGQPGGSTGVGTGSVTPHAHNNCTRCSYDTTSDRTNIDSSISTAEPMTKRVKKWHWP